MNRLEIDLKAFFEREQYAKATAEEKTAHPGSGQKALSRSVEPTGLGAQVMFNPQMDRRLKVKLVGVAPSDVDLANFLAGLTQVPFFEQVSIAYARDKVEAGHILREFEVSWSMGLNVPVGS